MEKTIPLTDKLHVKSSAHILYFYEKEQKYIQNMLAYIHEGVRRDDHLLVIENFKILTSIKEILNTKLTPKEWGCIHFVDNKTFYGYYKNYNLDNMLNHFHEQLDLFESNDRNIRTWAHVEWEDYKNVWDNIVQFEQMADCEIHDRGVVSVCAYAAGDVTASLQNIMMYSHEYIMTDKELAKSSFYENRQFSR